MKRKFKVLFLFVLLCGAVSSAFAQSVKPAEISEVIAFYEWAFETTFTQPQRAQFQKYLDADFRANAKNARKDTDTILRTWAQLQQTDSETQRQARAEFILNYIGDLRNSSDPDAKFLLGIYDAAHGDSQNDPRPVTNNANPQSGGGAPNQRLTGKWWRSTGAGGNDDGTGKTRYNSGTMFTFEFFADGTIEYISDHKTLSITQCKISEVMNARGTYTTKGNSLTIDFGPTTTIKSNSCNSRENGKKTAAASSISLKWKVKEDDSVFRPDRPLMLCFDGQGGEVCYEKDIPYRGN